MINYKNYYYSDWLYILDILKCKKKEKEKFMLIMNIHEYIHNILIYYCFVKNVKKLIFSADTEIILSPTIENNTTIYSRTILQNYWFFIIYCIKFIIKLIDDVIYFLWILNIVK